MYSVVFGVLIKIFESLSTSDLNTYLSTDV